jgi:hypothetical protein
MVSNAAAASRVAGTIGIFKWIVIAVQVLFGVILLFVLNAQEDWPTWTAAAGPLALVANLLSALFTWVLFGWFQHTLGMLSTIAANTLPQAPAYVAPPTPDPDVQIVR